MKIKNAKYLGSSGREALIDLQIPYDFKKDIIVFVHGYMGFKDWGPWNLMQAYFVEKGVGFCKFNLTHNGTTTDQPLEFVDLEVFASNCYSFEKKDVLHVLNWLEEKIDLSTCSLHLVGHSRGGGIALLNADDNRIKSVITLAAISSIEKRFDLEKEELDNWEKNGVRYVRNGRTNQDLPHNFSQFIDFEENKQELSIKTVCESISKPVMHIHGGKDESVSISEGYDLSRWSRNQLYEIPEATHTFGGIHPYDLQTLPTHLEECCNRILEFLEKQKLCT